MKAYAIIAGLVLLLAGSLYALFTEHRNLVATQVSLKAANARNEALVAATAAIQAKVGQSQATAGKARQGLDHVIQASPDWGTAATPEPVVDELCKFLTCVSDKPR